MTTNVVTHPVDDLAGPLSLTPGRSQSAGDVRYLSRAYLQTQDQAFQIVQARTERLTELVRQRRSHLAHHVQSCGAAEYRLLPFLALNGLLTLRHIRIGRHHPVAPHRDRRR